MPHWQRLHAFFRNHHLGKRLPSPDGRRHGGTAQRPAAGRPHRRPLLDRAGGNLHQNAIIPANTVVGLQSVVTKSFREEFTALAGNPAKVIKKGSNGAVKEKWAKDAQHVPPQLHGLNRLRMPGHVPQGAPRHADRRCPALPSSMLFPRSALLPETHFRLPIWG